MKYLELFDELSIYNKISYLFQWQFVKNTELLLYKQWIPTRFEIIIKVLVNPLRFI